jgi:hypothetical protein
MKVDYKHYDGRASCSSGDRGIWVPGSAQTSECGQPGHEMGYEVEINGQGSPAHFRSWQFVDIANFPAIYVHDHRQADGQPPPGPRTEHALARVSVSNPLCLEPMGCKTNKYETVPLDALVIPKGIERHPTHASLEDAPATNPPAGAYSSMSYATEAARAVV